ncbi:MAG TPA: glucose-6-phosphate dehydrogenase assembly protein OpcA [Pyrinomonadaceae bacterium]|jgi:glucose-6-phosphate dehydrogenase assembly protein OpcA|nr:glucose-6-phosphate dehydrogenase assembly protein OpcA [Pyrinomonadaceae bacterium]
MDQNIHFIQQEIPVKATLDVEAVETALNALWREKAGAAPAGDDENGALMRARVLNLMFYVTSAEAASGVNDILSDVTTSHPCRALLMVAEREKEDQDIKMSVSTFCPDSSDAGGRRVCCEQVTLKACGRYTAELPSAATPLLVSDLPIFLDWQDALRPDDEVFQSLSRAADRVVVDSTRFQNPLAEMAALLRLLSRKRASDVALSDLNWSRLTSWRALLASFYDVMEYRPALERISQVMIEYVAPASKLSGAHLAPQALMMAGWLASRLGWHSSPDELDQSLNESTRALLLEKDGRRLELLFRLVSRPEMKPGRLARVELKTESDGAASTFVVSRSQDGLYLETQVVRGEDVQGARVLKVRNRSAAVLLGRELEIIDHDGVYEEALRTAATLLRL